MNLIRLRIIIISSVIISFLIIIRIIYLSTLNPMDFVLYEKNEFNYNRGNIYDKNGKILAISDYFYSIYVNPNEITNKRDFSDKVSNIIKISKKEIFDKINTNKNFVWIKRFLDEDVYLKLKNENIKGVYFKKEYKRVYPNNRLLSHTLGFTDIDNRGVEGLEKSYNNFLISEPDLNEKEEKNNGLNIYLTIDANIQAVAEYCLKNGVERENADIGTLIFMDGKSGEIIAMASYPDFDPNRFTEHKQEDFRNPAIFNQYEPGSVFKVFTIASLLDMGYVTENDYWVCDGIFEKNGNKIKCTGIHGKINIAGIMKYSCNDATLQASDRMLSKEFYYYLKNFDFGEYTGINLLGEQRGLLRDLNNWSSRSKMAISIGQEISVNALQIVKAATTFINDGIMLEPLLVKSIKDVNSKTIKEFTRKEIRRVIKNGISKIIVDSMIESTATGGSVRRLKIEGIEFAAKSGTAQVFDTKLNRYSEDRVTSSLLVLFPANNPRYIIYTVYHNPKGKIKWGGIICAYLLNDFISNIIGYMDFDLIEKVKINEKDIK
ncbi:MAG TPA: penicillin-binding protein 2 [Spirochaetota bacterium]|nr:penicillin-binding protein 2 [Spirochaetota bacterium]